MSREVHVRFCEKLRGEVPLGLLDQLLKVSSRQSRLNGFIIINTRIMKMPSFQSLNGLKAGTTVADAILH